MHTRGEDAQECVLATGAFIGKTKDMWALIDHEFIHWDGMGWGKLIN